jgi:MoaA/NifB/PqqE/SkfB family radical SAM enzyme
MLPQEMHDALIDDVASLGTRRVTYSGGGDPLACSYAVQAMATAKRKGLKVTLISNLSLVKDSGSFLDIGIDTVLANCSAGDSATYMAFHPGCSANDFERMTEILRALVKRRTTVTLVCVVCAVNVNGLMAVVHYAAEIGARIQWKLMSATNGTERIALTDAQHEHVRKTLPQLRLECSNAGVVSNIDDFERSLQGTSLRLPIEDIGCHVGDHYARIDADGTVRYCCNPNVALVTGSLHNASFTEIWCGQRWAALRQQLSTNGFVSGCERCGKFGLNLELAMKKGRADGL